MRWGNSAPPKAPDRAIYTTNAVESFNAQLRKVLKTRGHMPNDEAALKLLFLATRHVTTRWKHHYDWRKALMQFAIFFEGRFTI